MALLHYLFESDERDAKLEWQRFKFGAIGAHPELTKEILALDEKLDEGEGVAQPLSDEEMEEYVPMSALEVDAILDDMKGFGLS